MTNPLCPNKVLRFGFNKIAKCHKFIWDVGAKKSSNVESNDYMFQCGPKPDDKFALYRECGFSNEGAAEIEMNKFLEAHKNDLFCGCNFGECLKDKVINEQV